MSRSPKPPFIIVFLCAVGITVFAGAALLITAHFWAQPSASQQAAIQAMDFTWKAGVGAILTLLGVRGT